MSREYLPRDRIVVPVVAIFDRLVRQLVLHRLLMPVGTLVSACAFPLGKKGTDLGPIAFVIRIGARQLLQHGLVGPGGGDQV